MSQGSGAPAPAGTITIEQLLALNDEIAALVRAGVPIERGLMEAGRDIRGRLGRIAANLAKRMNRGESLIQALHGEERSIPPLYRAVVEAGTRAGKLPVALEGLARYVRGYSEARAAIGLALWYPLLVLALAYGFFVASIVWLLPLFVQSFDDLRLTVFPAVRWLEYLGRSAVYWWPVGPVLLALVLLLWIRSGTATSFHSPAWGGLRFIPWMRSLLIDVESANFSELLALLLEHQVPYPSALVLAADSSGDPRLSRGSRSLAEALSRGESSSVGIQHVALGTFPPMLRWVLASGQVQGSLVESLRELTTLYRRRAQFKSEKLKIVLPTVLMVGIGGSAVLFYSVSLFGPFVHLLNQLSQS
jgi:type II secretory pathway component PulF